MKSTPLVTIICLCYNHENFVIESLNSVINQTYKNIQLIIVDDCSSDNSVKVIEKWLRDYPKIHFIKNETNQGNNKSFNNAFEYARGDFFIDLAADDVLYPYTLEHQLQAFIEHPKAALIFGNAELINEQSETIGVHFLVDANNNVVDKTLLTIDYQRILEGGNVLCSVSALTRTDVFRKLGGYDNSLAYEDLDFWIRLSRDYKIVFKDTFFIRKRVLQNSQSTFFYKRNKYAKKINLTTNIILNKAYLINKNKDEHKALLKRVHFQIVHNYKLRNWSVLLKNLVLKLKIHFTIVRLSF